MSQDILSDVLRSVRLRGVLYFHVVGMRDWVAEAPPARDIAAAVLPGSEHVMEFHVVTSGTCWAGLIDGEPARLTQGDIILFPHGDPHVVSSAPGMRAEPHAQGYFERMQQPLPFLLSLNAREVRVGQPPDDAGDATLVCGFLGCDLHPFNPLIAALPRFMHLHEDPQHEWINQCMRRAVAESVNRRPGGDAVLERLSEMMFVDLIRRYLNQLPEGGQGWLSGLRDRFVGLALALMHADPACPWSIDELGQRVGLSRSALHERFAAVVGQTPMQYLANWRMQRGAALLRDTSATVAMVALEVGYESEAAFSRAFKRLVGMPPALWRRQARA